MESKRGLTDWKAGALQMQSASAGSLVAKTAPKEKTVQKPRPKAGTKEKPFLEKTKEEKFGTKPRDVPPGKQVKDVLAYLEAHQARDEPISWEEIVRDAIPAWYDTNPGGTLYNLLIHNQRVLATVNGFQYRTEHGIHNKDSLLRYLKAHPDGVKSTAIKDGYENVLVDADQLQAEGLAYKFYNTEFKEDVYFPAPQFMAKADAEWVDVYLKTQLPQDPQVLITSMRNLQLPSMYEHVITKRKVTAVVKTERTKKKARRALNRNHMTNVHLTHLLTGKEAEQYTSIDRK